jgi:hypothetical protein
MDRDRISDESTGQGAEARLYHRDASTMGVDDLGQTSATRLDMLRTATRPEYRPLKKGSTQWPWRARQSGEDQSGHVRDTAAVPTHLPCYSETGEARAVQVTRSARTPSTAPVTSRLCVHCVAVAGVALCRSLSWG